jgi:hypothetical protein
MGTTLVKERLKTALGWIKYPRSEPQEVASAIGLPRPMDWEQLLMRLRAAGQPPRLYRYMARAHAQAIFASALRVEEFTNASLCSYHMAGGWLSFDLHFDLDQRLRRVYVSHPQLTPLELPLELPLAPIAGR